MKFTFTLFSFLIGLNVFAQWSDTSNKFTDSLHMQVTSAPNNQSASIIVRSYPDSAYFVIWQDSRNDASNNKTAIYAQKYTKAGVALWPVNGVPISSSTNSQHYAYNGQNYRNRSYAATDSAGGFYIGYADDSVTNYVYQRACVQHIKNDGGAVFSGPGYIVSSSTSGNFAISSQLIADGTGGFFYSFLGAAAVVGTPDFVYAYCFKDINGTLQSYGGGQMNQNAVQATATSPCGNYTYLNYTAADISDYNIFPDLQGGCNVVMYINVNGSGNMLGYNKLFRAKQNCISTQYTLGTDYTPMQDVESYVKGNVYRLYYLRSDDQTISCGYNGGIYTVTQYRLVQNGFLEIDGGGTLYDLNDPKGVTVSSGGNINATLLANWKRTYTQATGVSDPEVVGYVVKEEVYDSIPYQRASDDNPNYPGYNTTEPVGLNKLNNFRDTILPAPNNYDFGLNGGSNQIYASAVEVSGGIAHLQHLAVEAQSADSFAVVYKTDLKTGTVIGEGNYDVPPEIAVNQAGNAVYYIKDNLLVPSTGTASPRVSPVFANATLAWGAMGKPIGTGVWTNGYYSMTSPYISLDPVNGTALISWTDSRNNGITGYDVYMRHLDNLNNTAYEPPYPRVKPVPDPFGPATASANLYGTTNQFTTLQIFDAAPYTTDPGVSPGVDISDNYNLGTVNLSVYDNAGSIRTYNGEPYLDRSYTITPQNNPNGAATVTVRLFFTTAQFKAIQAADPGILTPGDLGVIKQPSGSGSGSTYSVVAGQQNITPDAWAAVDGGYYIEIQISSFSNFFIFKNTNALPITWLGVQATWQTNAQAKVSWQVAAEQNAKIYTIQYSTNDVDFTNVDAVTAADQAQYSGIVPAGSTNYYRIMETDKNGGKTYSKIVQLMANVKEVTIYPNPANDVLYIQGLQTSYSIKVIDMQGKLLQQQTLTAGSQYINIGRLSKGDYLLKLTNKAGEQTLKFTKL